MHDKLLSPSLPAATMHCQTEPYYSRIYPVTPCAACRPEKPEEVQKLQTLLDDLHEGFKETVVAARGERLPRDTAQLFTGRPWTGRQALQLGLVDGTDDMRSVMRRKFGQQVAKLLSCCSAGQTTLPWIPLAGVLATRVSARRRCTRAGAVLARLAGIRSASPTLDRCSPLFSKCTHVSSHQSQAGTKSMSGHRRPGVHGAALWHCGSTFILPCSCLHRCCSGCAVSHPDQHWAMLSACLYMMAFGTRRRQCWTRHRNVCFLPDVGFE